MTKIWQKVSKMLSKSFDFFGSIFCVLSYGGLQNPVSATVLA